MIDFVIENTKKEKIYYVGHSQGTTSFFVMASERPEYNDKITAMFALAPVAYVRHMTSPFFQILSRFDTFIIVSIKFKKLKYQKLFISKIIFKLIFSFFFKDNYEHAWSS